MCCVNIFKIQNKTPLPFGERVGVRGISSQISKLKILLQTLTLFLSGRGNKKTKAPSDFSDGAFGSNYNVSAFS
jgi:hypothetical protein